MHLSALALGALALGFLPAPLLAHEDDPKILDRLPPVTSQGFRRSLPAGVDTLLSPRGQAFRSTTYQSSGVQLLSWVPLNLIDGAPTGNDCWGYVAPSGREIGILGTRLGTAFFDLSDPGNPVMIGVVDGPNSLWRDIKTYSHYAYIVSEGGDDIQVVDLSQVDSGQVTLVGSVGAAGAASTHNIVIDEVSGYLYRSGGSNNGLRMYDLNANPAAPNYVGQWNTKYVHDAQVVTYTSGPYAGRQIAFCCSGYNGGSGQTGLTILDVTNKSNPFVRSSAYYPNPAYSHQGWLSEDRNYFYLGDELDENGTLPTTTHIIDVSNLNNPQVQGSFTNGNQAIGHNLYTKNGRIFAANYTSGLRIFDYTSNPLAPVETGYFDTFPANDGDTFNGLWSVFPYFPSGIVIGSDLERGLFVWYAGDPEIDVQVNGGVPQAVNPSGHTLDVTITESSPGVLAPGTAELVFDAGAGAVHVPLTHVSGDQYQAEIPSHMCGTRLNWYIRAQSTAGLTWTAPQNAPANFYESAAGSSLIEIVQLDMESPSGWISGAASDDATEGIWQVGDPNATIAQSGVDVTPAGTDCWFTGQGRPNFAANTSDVDDGTTTLLTSVMDLSANPGARIEYQRWYVNDGNANVDDSMWIDITADGTTWVNVETLGPGHPEASGGWFHHAFMASDFITPSAQVQVRFRVSDTGQESLVEGMIDEFHVSEVICPAGSMANYCDPAIANSTGLPAVISGTGSVTAGDNNLTLQADQMPLNRFGYFLAGTAQGFTSAPGGSQGNLCLGSSLARFSASNQIGFTGLTGSISLQVDLTQIPTNPSQPVLAGQTWYFQAWFRDVNPMDTSNFTDGLRVTFD
ncbi:MAG: choice-of-anchor B family protein [Planctomycetota bacterium]|nr:choice-of-anchor B family protein [Planctomycetota bacterium]